MAQGSTATAKQAKTVPEPANDPGELALADLARAVLSREIPRPRTAQVRRLAEAVLAAEEKRAKKKTKKNSGKKRKLAKIPGQKAKK